MLELRVQQFLDEWPVVSKEQGTLAVVVEATGCIDIRRESEFIEGAMSSLGSELAEYAKRLVEEYHHGGLYESKSRAKIHFSSLVERPAVCFCRKNSNSNDKIFIFAV